MIELLPVPLKALQIARHMMGFDPLWTEGIMTLQAHVAQLITKPDNHYGCWIPIRIIQRPGFIRIDESGLSGEYRASCAQTDCVLDIEPVCINPTAPVTLRGMLQTQLDVWPEAAAHLPLKAVIAQLAHPACVPYAPKIKDAFSLLTASRLEPESEREGASDLLKLKPYIDTLLADSSQAFSQLALCGREMALVLAFTTLANVVVDEAQRQCHDPAWSAKIEYILHRAFFSAALSCSDIVVDSFLHALASAGCTPLIMACVEQFESHINDAFEAAKAVGITAESSEENVTAKVCHDLGYALTLWSDMHHALKKLLPVAYAGQILARFLVDYADFPKDKAEKMRFAYKQCDEIVVIIMTSLSHAVRLHDLNTHASPIAIIRQAREKGGEREARAVIRHWVEQQAFYPRAWKKWLDQASQNL